MRIGVPGEFHEDRWQRTAEDSERCMLPRTRQVGGTHRIQVIAWRRGLLAGLRHSSPAHRYLSAIPAWRRGSSDRSSARQPCPQVLQSHPRVAKGRKSVPLTGLRSGLGPGLARLPCPQVLQRHSGVAKGTSIDPLARGPSTEPLLGQGHVARLSGTGVKPVSCRCFGRTSARHPRREASRWHHGVAKQSSIGSSSIKCRYSMDIEVRIRCLSIKCRCFMDVALTRPPGFSGDYFIPRISIPTS